MGLLNFLTQPNPILIKLIYIPLFITIIIILLKNSKYIFNKESKKVHSIIIFSLDFLAIMFIFFDFILMNNQNSSIINSIFPFIFTYLCISETLHIRENIELENSNEKIKNLETYNKTLNTKNDELSAFKHDFYNIIQTIGGLLQIGKYDNLKRYYNDLNIDCQIINDMEKLNPEMVKNPEVLTLLVNKYELAKQKGIRMNLEIYSDLSNLNTDLFQIIRILGILLDNAIEASTECEEKILNIELRKTKNNTETIIIENSYCNKEINTDSIFKKGFSTKKDNTGLGLWKVNKIIKQHRNLSLYTYKNDELFTQKLDICI